MKRIILAIIVAALMVSVAGCQPKEVDNGDYNAELDEIVVMVNAMIHMDAMQVQGDIEAKAKDMASGGFEYDQKRLQVMLLIEQGFHGYEGSTDVAELIQSFEATAMDSGWTGDVTSHAMNYDTNGIAISEKEEAFVVYIKEHRDQDHYEAMSLEEIREHFEAFTK